MNVSFALLIALSLTGADGQTNWPGFLGGGPVQVQPASLPLTWSPTEGIAWQAPLLGYGQSSPVVWNGQVFVTAVEGPMKDSCHVLALDLASGRQRWKHSLDSSDKVKDSNYVSRAAPTPVADGRGVYAFFESGDVVALSHEGRELWRRSLSGDYGKFVNEFGLAASPVQTSDAIVLLIDHDGPSYLIALSKSDGRTLWKTDRASRRSWSSPALVPVAGKLQVVCSSLGSADGYDPATGELLWSFADVTGNTAATPLPFADGRFLVGASPGREAGERSEGAKKSNLAAAIELMDGKPSLKVLWRTEEATPTFASPIVYAGHAYWINRVGVVYCFDAVTGEVRYTERTKQSCWATPLGAGDRLYLFGKDGLTTVLRAGPKFEVLAENQLWDPASFKPDPARIAREETEERKKAAAMFSGPVQYGVAAVDGSLLIRTGQALYCLRPHNQ
jgi:outer membrane protein assembly factor BamB